MQAFLNDTNVKAKYVARVTACVMAGEITEAFDRDERKGCAVRCTIKGEHTRYETELGIPREVALLEDAIFEILPNAEAMNFPLQFLQAVGVGKDLSKVAAQIVIWQFEDGKYGLKNISKGKDHKEVYGFCEEVVALYKRILAGEKMSEKEFYRLYLKADHGKQSTWVKIGVRAEVGANAWVKAWMRAWTRSIVGQGVKAWVNAGAWVAEDYADYEARTLALRGFFLKVVKEA